MPLFLKNETGSSVISGSGGSGFGGHGGDGFQERGTGDDDLAAAGGGGAGGIAGYSGINLYIRAFYYNSNGINCTKWY